VSASFTVADMNNDGVDDLLTATGVATQSLGVWLGSGDGTFAPPLSETPTPGPVSSLTTYDLDADGDLDVIYGINAGLQWNEAQVLVVTGNGDGTLSPRASANLTGGTSINRTIVADFDGDDRLDMVVEQSGYEIVGNETSHPTVLLRGLNPGAFGPAETLENLHWSSAWATRFNCDGAMDLIGYDGIRLGRGDGTFEPLVPFNVANRTTIYGSALGDFDGDAFLDVATLDGLYDPEHQWSEQIDVALNHHDGSFTTVVTPVPDVVWRLAAADVDGDGRSDILYTSENVSNATFGLALSRGDGTFGPPTTMPGQMRMTGDFNGDGRLDVGVTSESDGGVVVDVYLSQCL
jgi:hypothetical protein